MVSPSVPPMAMVHSEAVPSSAALPLASSTQSAPASVPAFSSSHPQGMEAGQDSIVPIFQAPLQSYMTTQNNDTRGDASAVLHRVQALQESKALSSGIVPAVERLSLQLILPEAQLAKLLGAVGQYLYQVESLNGQGLIKIEGSADGILALLQLLPEYLTLERQAVLLHDSNSFDLLGRYIFEPDTGYLVHTTIRPIGGGASAFALKRIAMLAPDQLESNVTQEALHTRGLAEIDWPLSTALPSQVLLAETTAQESQSVINSINTRMVSTESNISSPITLSSVTPSIVSIPVTGEGGGGGGGGVSNTVPVVGADADTAVEDTPLIINISDLLLNDSDAQQVLTDANFALTTTGAQGTVVNNGDGTLTYTPNADYHGADSFTYTITDAGGLTGTATVNLTVTAVNDAPVATDDTFAINENSANATVVGTVTASDVDTGDMLTYAITAGNGLGGFAINAATGQITVADATKLDYETTTSFTLTVSVTDNGTGTLSDTATITINLNDVAETLALAGAIADMAATASGAAAYTYNTSTHFSGGIGALTYTISSIAYSTGDPSTWVASSWTAGALSINSTSGVITGTPDINDRGTVYITVTATDTAMNAVSESFELFLHDGALSFTGTTAGESLTGTAGADDIFGDSGDDTVSAGDGADTVHGGDGADSIHASSAADLVYGGQGNDTIIAGIHHGTDGADTVYGGDGADSIEGGYNNDLLFGGDGNDTLDSGFGTDTLYGGAGNDYLKDATGGNGLFIGGTGSDTFDGGDGNDTITVEADDYLYVLGGMGADSIVGSSGNDTIIAGIHHSADGNDTVYGGDGADSIEGNYNNDLLYGGDGNDTLDSGFGTDTLYGGAGNDYLKDATGGNGLFIGGTGSDTFDGGDGNDTITVEADDYLYVLGSYGADSIVGSSGNDTIIAGIHHSADGNDTVYGGDGADSIKGEYNDDLLYGGTGTDTLTGDHGSDTLDGGADADTLIGGTQADTFLFTNLTHSVDGASDLITDFSTAQSDKINLSALGITGIGGGATQVTISNDGTYTYVNHNSSTFLVTLTGVQALVAGDFVFDTSAPTLSSVIPDMAATADGATGFTYNASTHFSDPAGITYSISSVVYSMGDPSGWVAANWAAGALAINSSTGIITGTPDVNDRGVVYITVTATDAGGLTTSESFELFLHDGALTNSGTAAATSITGTAGADDLFGDSGNDTVDGGNGNDTIHGGDNADSINGGIGIDLIFGGQGSDTLEGGNDNDDTLYGGEDGDYLTDSHGFNTVFYGGSGSDTIIGTTNNLAYGGDGNDRIVGQFSYDDTFYGGAGNDTIWGDFGDDLLYGDDGADSINGWGSEDTIYGGTGTDIIIGYDSNDLIYGGDDSDTLTGDAGSDTLYGDAGTDTLSGGFDADTLDGGAAADTLTGGFGIDKFYFANLTHSVDGSSDLITDWDYGGDHDIIDLSALGITGIGVGATEVTISNDGTYTYVNHNSSTFLVTLTGVHALVAGDFVFAVNNPPTIVTEVADMVATADGVTGFSYDVSTHFTDTDALTYSISSIVYSTGNPSGWGVASWTAGALSINASTGVITGTPDVNDRGVVYITLSVTDTGGNTIWDSFELFLHDGALTDAGTSAGTSITGTAGADDLFGDSGDDTITGSSGTDTIHGGDGADSINAGSNNKTIYGGQGGDIIIGSTSADRIYGGDGSDILDASSGADSVYGGSGADTLQGWGGNDVLYGEAGADSLWGGAVDDSLDGGGGLDTLTGDTGIDTFLFTNLTHSTITAPDRITDFENGLDRINLAGLGFTALSDFETLSHSAGVTTLADTQTSFAITFTGDVTAQLDNTDFIF